MEPETLKAFLPAWLLRSMETISDDSILSEMTRVVRDYLVACSAFEYWKPSADFGLKWWGP